MSCCFGDLYLSLLNQADGSIIIMLNNTVLDVGSIVQVVYMAMVGTFPFNAFLSGVLSCVGTSVLGGTFFDLISCQNSASLLCHASSDESSLG